MSHYPVRVQAVRSKGCAQRPFVNLPIALAKALDIEKGELVEWKIVDRRRLLLLRGATPSPLPPKPRKPAKR